MQWILWYTTNDNELCFNSQSTSYAAFRREFIKQRLAHNVHHVCYIVIKEES